MRRGSPMCAKSLPPWSVSPPHRRQAPRDIPTRPGSICRGGCSRSGANPMRLHAQRHCWHLRSTTFSIRSECPRRGSAWRRCSRNHGGPSTGASAPMSVRFSTGARATANAASWKSRREEKQRPCLGDCAACSPADDIEHKSFVLHFLHGGPSSLETSDPKPDPRIDLI